MWEHIRSGTPARPGSRACARSSVNASAGSCLPATHGGNRTRRRPSSSSHCRPAGQERAAACRDEPAAGCDQNVSALGLRRERGRDRSAECDLVHVRLFECHAAVTGCVNDFETARSRRGVCNQIERKTIPKLLPTIQSVLPSGPRFPLDAKRAAERKLTRLGNWHEERRSRIRHVSVPRRSAWSRSSSHLEEHAP